MMRRFISRIVWTAGAGAVAVAIFSYYRSAVTGRDMMSVVSNLPEELKQASGECRERLQAAISLGKEAAAMREAEIEAELAGVENGLPEPPDYVV